MDKSEFVKLFKSKITDGLSLQNPGGGTSTVVWCNAQKVCYKRGNLSLYIELEYFYRALQQFNGRVVATTDLKKMVPQIFDSAQNGHSCHCTFFFMALREMGLVEKILGTGRVGNPFHVRLPSTAAIA